MNKFGQNTKEEVLKILQDPDAVDNLTDEQKELVERWSFAYSTYMLHKNPKKVTEMIMEHYHVSRSTAYAYVNAATEIYGGQKLIDATADLIIWDALTKGLDLSIKEGDMKAYARITGEMNKYSARRQSMLQEFDPAMLKTGDFVITINPADIGFTPIPPEDLERLRRQVSSKRLELREYGNGSFGQ